MHAVWMLERPARPPSCLTCMQDVDTIMMRCFSDLEPKDMDDGPLLVLSCGHAFLVSTLDGLMELPRCRLLYCLYAVLPACLPAAYSLHGIHPGPRHLESPRPGPCWQTSPEPVANQPVPRCCSQPLLTPSPCRILSSCKPGTSCPPSCQLLQPRQPGGRLAVPPALGRRCRWLPERQNLPKLQVLQWELRSGFRGSHIRVQGIVYAQIHAHTYMIFIHICCRGWRLKWLTSPWHTPSGTSSPRS